MKLFTRWTASALALAVALSLGSADAQTTIYSEDFSAAGGLLNGVAEDAQGALWVANGAFLANGTTNGDFSGSALLDITLQPNAVYTLGADITVQDVDGDWGGIGFASGDAATFIGAPGADGLNDDRFTDGPGGRSWMLLRDQDGTASVGDIEAFGGPSTTNGGLAPQLFDIVAGSTYAAQIVLTTSADGLSYTSDFLIDGFSVSNGPVLINNSISLIGSVGLTFNDDFTNGHIFDNFLLTEQILGAAANEWNVDGGGSFNAGGNWTLGLPAAGSDVVFGAALTAANSPGTVTLDSAVSLNRITIGNPDATYILDGPNALTLTGDAVVSVTSGSHEVAAQVSGSAGLTKEGAGVLTLSNVANNYTGNTNVNAGTLQATSLGALNQASGSTIVATGATLQFVGDGAGNGASGVLSEALAGDGQVRLDGSLTSETITASTSNPGFNGTVSVGGGTLLVTNAGALGSATGGTTVEGEGSTGTLRLSGVNLSAEPLTLGARTAGAIDPHVSGAGSNTLGAITGDLGGEEYNLESQSGTLTVAGDITMPDTQQRNLNLSGSGSGVINGSIVDRTLAVGDGAEEINVNVFKRGAGVWTIATGGDNRDDFHQGRTVIEEGTLAVQQSGADQGELWSTTIEVRSDAVFDISSFGTQYSLQVVNDPDQVLSSGDETGQTLAGSGTINLGAGKTLAAFDDSIIAPGDSVGTLSLTGNFNYSSFGANVTGGFNYELGDTAAPGDSDLLSVSGSVSMNAAGGNQINVRVSPVEGTLAEDSYALISAPSVGGSATNANYNVVVFDAQGNDITADTRHTFTVTNSANAVNLNVANASANLNWSGTAGDAWDVNATNNWTGGDTQFSQLDNVTFGNVTNKNVQIGGAVAPGSVVFDGGAGTTYTVSGAGGMTGYGDVSVDSGTVQLFNTGNAYAGATTVAAGARLEMVAGTTGDTVVSGTLAVTNNTVVTLIDDFEDASLSEYTFAKILDQGTVTNSSFVSPAGVLANTSAGADGAEQSLFFRNDFTLAVGEELRADAEFATINGNDLGIAVGETPVGIADGGTGDTRAMADFLFVSLRIAGQLNSRGFNSGGEIGQVQEFGQTVDQLFIARTGTDTIELGWYEGVTRNVLRSETVSASIFDNIGFYGDLRADAAGYSGLDDLRIQVGSEDLTLNIDGDLQLADTGVLEFELSNSGFADLAISGAALLDGTVEVLLDNFAPNDGAAFTLLTAAGGLTDLGVEYLLPEGFAASIVNATDLVITFTEAVALPGDANGDGSVDILDLDILSGNFGTMGGATVATGDFNGDGNVDILDLDILSGNFGSMASAAAAVPEPATLCLLVLTLAPCAGCRRRN